MEQQSQPLYSSDNDEIDLRELWQKLVEGKWLITITTLFVTLGAAAYTQLVTPTYKASTYLLAPLVQDIQELNQKELNHKEYSSESVFARYLLNMQSRNLRQTFFEQQQLLALYTHGKTNVDAFEVFEKNFHQKLIIEKPAKADPKPYTELSFELKNSQPELTAQHLNAYVAFIANHTKQELLAEVQFEIANQTKLINEQIVSKKELAEQRRRDRIKQLEESLIIAQQLGIEQQTQLSQSDNKLYMDYNRGTRALKAELAVLKARESDEPFIDGLRNLQERIAYLNNLAIHPEKLSVVRIDQQAEVPYEVLKPKSNLIIAVAVVLGLMLGMFGVLVRGAFSRQVEVV